MYSFSSVPLWKARFGKEIVSSVVDCTLTVKPPKYSVILDLDRKIRDFELPKFTQEPLPENGGLNLFMSHYMPKNYREFSALLFYAPLVELLNSFGWLVMLYVHRGYFAMALNDFPTDPLRSQYAPSFLAGYRSACNLLSEMRDQFAKFPTQIARFWVLWTHGFSAVVMLGSVVTHGATTKTSQAALAELRLAKELFEKAAEHGGRAVKFLVCPFPHDIQSAVLTFHSLRYDGYMIRRRRYSQMASNARISLALGIQRRKSTTSYLSSPVALAPLPPKQPGNPACTANAPSHVCANHPLRLLPLQLYPLLPIPLVPGPPSRQRPPPLTHRGQTEGHPLRFLRMPAA